MRVVLFVATDRSFPRATPGASLAELRAADLPLNFHPVGVRVSANSAPAGAGEATIEEHAKAAGDHRDRGRKPSFTRGQLDAIRTMLAEGAGISAIAKATRLTRQRVSRVKEDPVAAEAMLAR